MRLRIIATGGILLSVLVGLTLSGVSSAAQEPPPTPTLSPDAEVLRDLFYSPECQSLCFLGIEPRVTTQEELIAWLESQNIEYALDDTLSIADLQWRPPSRQFLKPNTAVLTTINDGTVEYIISRIEAPIAAVIEVFGTPPITTYEDVNPGVSYLVYLVYPDLGLAFKFGKFPYNGITTSFSLSWVGNGFTWSEYPLGSPVTQDCPTYGTPPCIVPTATPTPSEAETLRDLFYNPECQLPCFMDLEPGVTTLAELEAILAQNAIPYTFDPGDEGNGFLQWLPDGSQTFVGDGAFEFGVTVTIANNLVWHMIIPLNAPVQAVQEVFGSPAETRWNPDDTDYYMIYPNMGLAFQVDTFYSSERTHLLVSTVVDNPWAIINNPLGESVDHPCPTYGTPPCIVPTATPTPTILPTNTPAPQS